MHQCLLFSAFCILCGAHCPMTGWICQWKPFWIPVDDSFKNSFVEEWVFQVTDTSDLSFSRGQGDVIPETPKVSMPVPSSLWGPPKNEDSACSRKRIEAPLPPLLPRPACERLELPFSCDAIYLVSSGSDQFTMWGNMSHQEILAEHVVDIHKKLLPTSVMLMNAFSRPPLSLMVSTNTVSLNHLCRRGSALTTGTRGPDEVRKMLLRNKLQESGISLPCKKLPNMSNTKFFTNDFT